MRLAADQVATGPAGQRAVALVGTPLATQHEAEITNAALDGRLVGTPVYVLGDADGVTAATRQTLEFTGGTSYAGAAGSPLQPYDDLAADLVNRYRVSLPAVSGAATVQVRLAKPPANAAAGP